MAVKPTAKAELPQNAEQLRYRVRLWGTGLIFTGLQQTNRRYLQDLHPQLFADYTDYLLGKFVYGLAARGPNDPTPFAVPAWDFVLSYDYEVRAAAYRLLRKGHTLAEAMRLAWNDTVMKERYFTTPLAWEERRALLAGLETAARPSRPQPPAEDHAKGNVKKTKKQKKQDSKDRGKGKGKSGCRRSTPEGEPICFAYNSPQGCPKGQKCQFLHVCGKCFGKHTLLKCESAGPKKAD